MLRKSSLVLPLLLLASLFFYSAPPQTAAKRIEVAATPVQQSLFEGPDVEQFRSPVSVAVLASGNLLMANYSNVFLFDPRSSELKRLKPDTGGLTKIFNPTGIAVHDNRVFIANYTGNNVLEAKIDEAAGALTVIDAISSPNTKSPEGVAFDGIDTIGAANYDGSSVQLFKRTGEKWGLSCEIPTPYAHGVTFLNGYFFASSLGDRNIIKIDPTACSIVAKAGSRGWKLGQYLWPTSLSVTRDKQILVADAHTGMLTVLSPDNLAPLRSFGGNGPGAAGLNMPYGAAEFYGSTLVTSTFGNRLMEFNQSGQPSRAWSTARDHQWSKNFAGSAFLHNQDYSIYTSPAKIQIDGKCYHPNYGRLSPCWWGPSITVTRIKGDYFYFAQATKTNGGVVVSSPQNEYALYFRDGQQPIDVFVGPDVWDVDGVLIGPSGKIHIDQ